MKTKLFMVLLALQFTAQAAPDTPWSLLLSASTNNAPNLEQIKKHTVILADLGISLVTPIYTSVDDIKTPAEHIAYMLFSPNTCGVEHDTDRAKALENAKTLKNLGVDLSQSVKYTDNIKTPLEYIAHMLFSPAQMRVRSDNARKKIAENAITLKELGIGLDTRLRTSERDIKTIEEKLAYIFCSPYTCGAEHDTDREKLAESAKILKELGIGLDTRNIEAGEDIKTPAESLVYKLFSKNAIGSDIRGYTRKVAQIKDLGVDLNKPVPTCDDNIKTPAEHIAYMFFSPNTCGAEHDTDRAKALENAETLKSLKINSETIIRKLHTSATTPAEYLVWLCFGKSRNDPLFDNNRTQAAQEIKTLKGLGIKAETQIKRFHTSAATPAEHLVWLYFGDAKDYKGPETRTKSVQTAQTLKDLGVDLNKKIEGKEDGSAEEQLVYCLRKDLPIDDLVKKLHPRGALAIQGIDTPSKMIKQDFCAEGTPWNHGKTQTFSQKSPHPFLSGQGAGFNGANLGLHSGNELPGSFDQGGYRPLFSGQGAGFDGAGLDLRSGNELPGSFDSSRGGYNPFFSIRKGENSEKKKESEEKKDKYSKKRTFDERK